MEKEQMYQRALQNSVGEEKKVKYVKMPKDAYLSRLKAAFAAGAVVAILSTSLVIFGASNLIESIKDASILNDELQTYDELVRSETHRTSDGQGYYYDNYKIASEIKDEDENIDKAIFGVYENIGYNQGNKILQMNEVLRALSSRLGVDNATFKDYVINKGFIDKEGNANYMAYEMAMTKMIVSEHKIDEMQSDIDEMKSR